MAIRSIRRDSASTGGRIVPWPPGSLVEPREVPPQKVQISTGSGAGAFRLDWLLDLPSQDRAVSDGLRRFLDTLVTELEEYSDGRARQHALRLMKALGLRTRSPFPDPQATPTEEGGINFDWDIEDRYHVNVEVMKDGTAEWFVRDRRISQWWNGEISDVGNLPATFVERLLIAFEPERSDVA